MNKKAPQPVQGSRLADAFGNGVYDAPVLPGQWQMPATRMPFQEPNDAPRERSRNEELADKIRFIVDKIEDEDIADELASIADEVEVDAVYSPYPMQIKRTSEAYDGQIEDLKQCVRQLVTEIGWVIEDEEIPSGNWNDPRKKTKTSHRLRKMLIEYVDEGYINSCAPWYQDEKYGDKNE